MYISVQVCFNSLPFFDLLQFTGNFAAVLQLFVGNICLLYSYTMVMFCYSGLFARKLKKKVLTEWVTMWWEARKEWALNIRADLHYRFVSMLAL